MKTKKLFIFFIFVIFPTFVFAQVLSNGQPSVLKEDKNQPNYVYDLKLLIKKSKENIKNVDVKIKEQAVVKRNQKREEKAREYYLNGLKLQEEGRLEEAREEFDKAIRITDHPEMRGYIKESTERTKAQADALRKQGIDESRRESEEERAVLERVENSYQVAVSLYKQQRFSDAKTEFEAVEEMYPDYKATRSYLQIVDQEISVIDRKEIKEQKAEIIKQQKELEVARLREKELWRKEIEKKEEDRKNELKKQAATVYNEALKLYQDKKFEEAKDKFQQVEWVVPDFKGTRGYIARVEQDIEAQKKKTALERQKQVEGQRWEETLAEKKAQEERRKFEEQKEKDRLAQVKDQAEFLYSAAVTLFDKPEYVQAKEKFEEVEKLHPNYKSTRFYLQRLEKILEQEEKNKRTEEEQKIWEEEFARRKADKARLERMTEEAEEMYRQAANLYRAGRLIEAKDKFLAVDQRVPDYKNCRERLAQIDKDIELLAKTKEREASLAEQKAEIERMKSLKQQAESVYRAAEKFYNAKDFQQAKEKFLETEKIFPGYKSTASYLRNIDDDINRRKDELARLEEEKRARDSYDQAVKLHKAGQYEEAKKLFLVTAGTLTKYKDTAKYLENIDEDIIRKKEEDLARVRHLQIAAPYEEAVRLYDQKSFEAAKSLFLEVLATAPDYKDTAKYLERIDDDIEQQKKDEVYQKKAREAEELYSKAVNELKANNLRQAKENFLKAELLVPNYKDSERYLSQIEKMMDEERAKQDKAALEAKVKPLYDQAVDLYKAQDFISAGKLFYEISFVYPEYKETLDYQKKIAEVLNAQSKLVERQERQRVLEGLYREALAAHVKRDYILAKKKFLQASSVDSAYKDVAKYLSRIDQDIKAEAERVIKNETMARAEAAYEQGVEFYVKNDLVNARKKFEEAALVDESFKKARENIARIDSDLAREKSRARHEQIAESENHYRLAHLAMAQENLEEAYQHLSQMDPASPNYAAGQEEMKVLGERLAMKGKVVEPVSNLNSVSDRELDPEYWNRYLQAIQLYKARDYERARVAFEAVAENKDFGFARDYAESARKLQTLTHGLNEKIEVEPIQIVTAPVPDFLLAATNRAERKSQAVADDIQGEKVISVYKQAVNDFKANKFEEARAGFLKVQELSPGFRSTEEYLKRIAVASDIADDKMEPPSAAPKVAKKPDAPRAEARTTEEPAKAFSAKPDLSGMNPREAAVIRELAAKSEKLYRQIKTLAEDEEMTSAAKTFAQVDRIIANLERQQREMQAKLESAEAIEREQAEAKLKAEKEAISQSASDAKAEALRLKNEADRKKAEADRQRDADMRQKDGEYEIQREALYQRALNAYKEKDFARARDFFRKLEESNPSYKDTGIILNRMDKEEEEQELVKLEDADRNEIRSLADKANQMNVEIVGLAQEQRYLEARQKFNEMDEILRTIQDIKFKMFDRRKKFASRWERRSMDQKKTTKQKFNEFMAMPKVVSNDQARVLFREGQELYSRKMFPEAKVKFMDALELDPGLRAAGTYIGRIDRVLEKRDFEEHQRQLEARNREFEQSRQATEPPSDPAAAVERAAKLLEEGTELYHDQHFREARVKFEELVTIGDAAQKKKAERFLSLIKGKLQEEKKLYEFDRKEQQARYIKERQEQSRIERRQLPSYKPAGDFEKTIQREQNLRQIERENARERARMLKTKKVEESKAVSDDRKEAAKFRKVSADTPMESAPPAQEIDKAVTALKGKEAADEEKAPAKPVDPQIKKQKVRIDALRRAEVRREKARQRKLEKKYQKKILKQRSRVEKEAQYFEKAERSQERKAERRIEKKIKIERKDTEAVKSPETPEKPVVEQKSKAEEPVVVSPAPVVLTPVVEKPAEKPVQKPVSPAVQAAPSALELEKKALDEQREAIRRDFEAGVERLYNEAVDYYKKRQYDEAKADFEQVNDMILNYKKTSDYLAKISKMKRRKPEEPVVIPAVINVVPQPAVPAPTDRAKVVTDALDSFDIDSQP